MAIWNNESRYTTGWQTMSKITNVRLPNAVSSGYSPEQMNQLIRSLEQIILQLNATYTAVTSEDKDQAQTWFFGK